MTACSKCLGEGKIANDDDGSPWSMWEELPEASKVAIRIGLIYPIDCPRCSGTGELVIDAEVLDEAPAIITVDEIQLVLDAVHDPESVTPRMMSWPGGIGRAVEPEERWQARAMITALDAARAKGRN